MTGDFAGDKEKAAKPEDLPRLFLDRANAGDVDGVVALYETGAVSAPDGSWLWAVDQPGIV